MTLPNAIVPGFPYEGGFYWLLGEVTKRHPLSHGYYLSLYGIEAEKMAVRSAALACLFERIELASADHALPDYAKYVTGDDYYHPELRLAMSWQDREWSKEGEAFARFASRTRILDKHFATHPLFSRNQDARRHFLCRLVQQIRLAIRRNAVIVGDDFFQSVYSTVAPHIKAFMDDSAGTLPSGITLAINHSTLAVTGLDFAPSNFDAFAAVRASKEVSDYAASFRKAIGKARDSSDPHDTLLDLMREAMDSERVSELAAGAFQSTGSVLNVVGMVPVLGTGASVGSIAADIAGRAAAAQARHERWYLLGPKMKEVSLKGILRKRQRKT